MTITSSQPITVSHSVIDLKAAFDSFTHELERLAGRFEPQALRQGTDAASVWALIEGMQGEQGLMIFGMQDHGRLPTLHGQPQKAFRYHIGNPLVAFSMTRHDIRAALYAPLTVLVYAIDAQTTRVEFDLPSSLFGQFGHPEVTEVGLQLDKKLTTLIEKAAEAAKA
ncbi:DUF302 domain-containing protein [Dyella flava]|uniref:DUF302 domain-containing protein n=1 Tax=Dyella flava TaxID=1920170 RepID=A0ABS2K266_9GAMM|nr:DUF302 domain-containing protein [Dyella flava]MBM7125150.1 DUF302 domain-containing protein [Dyella flava]GLQ52024.1 hypothetical protein GCM10010872_34730 [Dyella flava]